MFLDVELDICPAYGWQGGPEFSTRVMTTRSWVERRNTDNAYCRHSYSLPLQNITNTAYLQFLKQVFLACRGKLHSFKVKDFADFEAKDEAFFEGDGTTKIFQLRKESFFGIASYIRLITKPVADTVVIKVNGVEAAATVDGLTGKVTFAEAPADGAVGTWSGEFRVPVRFNMDVLNTTIDNRNREDEYIINGSVDLIEVFE